jgi:YD repeat-containing protein
MRPFPLAKLGSIGTASSRAAGAPTSYAYDALNHLVQTTDALGGVSHQVYDAVGNLVARVNAAGEQTNENRSPNRDSWNTGEGRSGCAVAPRKKACGVAGAEPARKRSGD